MIIIFYLASIAIASVLIGTSVFDPTLTLGPRMFQLTFGIAIFLFTIIIALYRIEIAVREAAKNSQIKL